MSEFNNKIIAIQNELEAPKNQYNSFGKYKYRSCEDIMEALKPLLKKHGIRQTISDDIVEVGGRVYVQATVHVTNGEDEVIGTAYAREAENKKGMDDSQITGTASSYARKYALNGLWLIDDAKDADTDEYRKKTHVNGKQTSNEDEKPWLNEGTKEWDKTVMKLQSGQVDTDTVYEHFAVNRKNRKQLETIEEAAKNGAVLQ